LSSHYTKNMVVDGAVFAKIYNLATIQPVSAKKRKK